SDLKTLEHLPASGERALFLPQTEDNPAICLLAETIRLHQGAIHLQSWQSGWLRLQILFPDPSAHPFLLNSSSPQGSTEP
uniref:hypothetical protein n=1 Tax=Candidatus Magnetaquicoccus inordinatus TaxID=2496818 RepID=UPI00187D2EA2